MSDLADWLTPEEFGRLLRPPLQKRQVQRLVQRGVIPARKFGRFCLIPRSALKAAQARKTTPGPEPDAGR